MTNAFEMIELADCWVAHGYIDPIITQFSDIQLSSVEASIGSRRKNESSQKEYLASRCLSKYLASLAFYGSMSDWQVAYNSNQLPELFNIEGKPMGSISISHSAGYAAVILNRTSSPVGIDVEMIKNRTDLRGILLLICQPRELDWFDAQPSLERFYRLWTAKEAIVKIQKLSIWDGLTPSCAIDFNQDNAMICQKYKMTPFQSSDARYLGAWTVTA